MPTDSKPLPTNALKAFTPQIIAWMAGLLEGEAYFCSLRTGITVRLAMTDEDVVNKFALLWQVTPRTLATRAEHHKTVFCATLPSRKAVQCMQLISPYMGRRRTQKISDCLARYFQRQTEAQEAKRERLQKITDSQLAKLWNSRPALEALRPFCERVGAGNRTTVGLRLQRLKLVPGSAVVSPIEFAMLPRIDLAVAPSDIQSAWLGGLLEGEGSFRRNGGGIAVSLQMTDEDVVRCYANLVGARAYQGPPGRKSHFKPCYLAIASGHRGATVMQRILPHMGERRTAKINECLHYRDIGQARLREIRAQYESRLPAESLARRWTTRKAGETLSTFAREYSVHPQVMKKRLIELAIYEPPAYKGFPDVQHVCELCHSPFTRPGTFRGQYCSRTCSGRAQAARRAAHRAAAATSSVRQAHLAPPPSAPAADTDS